MFAVADAVLALCPDATVYAVVARGVRNGASDDTSRRGLAEAVAAAGDLLAPHPHLEAWRAAYRAFGAKPQRTPCSAEALRRRAARGDLPAVNRLVDIYNAVSIRFATPIGGEDLAAVRGTERLIRAAGDETFDTIKDGQPAQEHPEIGEVVWRDDLGVTCRRWNWRQCRRTALTEATVDAVFLVEGLGVDLAPVVDDLVGRLGDAAVTVDRLT